MNRFLVVVLLLAGLLPMEAVAADMPVKAPAVLQATQPYSGLYLGAIGAVAKTPTDVAFLDIPGTGNIKPSGAMAGLLIGAGTWTASGLFLGFEVDGSYDFSKSKQPCAVIADCTVKSGLFFTQRLVLGAQLSDITGAVRRAGPVTATQWRDSLNVPSTLSASTIMPYLTLGIAERRIEACIEQATGVVIDPGPLPAAAVTGNSSCKGQWLVGGTGGGGLRVPVSSGFSIGAEYLYVRYNKHFAPADAPPILPADFKAISEHVARVSLTGHF